MGTKATSSAPVRIDADLYDSAKSEGARSSRSAAQQVDYWARLGRAVSMVETPTRRRIEAAIDGTRSLSELSAAERVVANAEIDTAIERQARAVSFGDRLAAEGVTTVATDDDGNLVEYRPDGTSAVIG